VSLLLILLQLLLLLLLLLWSLDTLVVRTKKLLTFSPLLILCAAARFGNH